MLIYIKKLARNYITMEEIENDCGGYTDVYYHYRKTN